MGVYSLYDIHTCLLHAMVGVPHCLVSVYLWDSNTSIHKIVHDHTAHTWSRLLQWASTAITSCLIMIIQLQRGYPAYHEESMTK